jgi:hypothetical protein
VQAASGRWGWPLLVFAVALWPLAGVFTFSRAFVQRDLTLHFWPKYLWLRHTVWGGEWPLWDPFMGGGQSAIADALNQLVLLPTLALRLLLPEPIGFNLWVALPFPLAAIGAYVFFRRHASAAGAALGGIIFATSGPIPSSGNFPNLSWSIMFVPWLLWALDAFAIRRTPGRAALLATLFAGQICAGEPVTMAATGALLALYACTLAPLRGEGATGWRPRLQVVALALLALMAGAALATVQLWPQLDVASRSMRGLGLANGDFWSIHPLWLLESIAPTIFGNFSAGFINTQPWLQPLNGGRDPFFYSIYLGVPTGLLALVGLRLPPQRRWTLFWGVVAIVSVIAALGDHTVIYPAAEWIVPVLRGFRYPAKYLVFLSLACSALAVAGWTVLERQRQSADAEDDTRLRSARRLVVACGLLFVVVGYAIAAAALLFPDQTSRALFRLAVTINMNDPVFGVVAMMPELPAHGARLLLMSVVSTGFVWLALSKRPEARRAQWLLFGMIAVDLAVTNGSLNPTGDVSLLKPPPWTTIVLQHPHERFYFGGRLDGNLTKLDVDGPREVTLAPQIELEDVRVVTSTRLLVTPSSIGAREMTTYDLSGMAPLEPAFFIEQFKKEGREKRQLALGRTGVRDCLISDPLPAGAKVLARVQNMEDVGLFECHPNATRASIIATAEVIKSHREQILRLFDEKQSDAIVLLDAPPPEPTGAPGAPVEPFTRFVRDGSTVVELEAGLPAGGGYVLLRDSFDPGWQAFVDDMPAPVLRANALFRAVRVNPGTHHVRFDYRPAPLVYGAWLSGLTAAGLIGLVLWSWRRERAPVSSSSTVIGHAARI